MTPYHFKLLYDISTLQSKVKEKDSKIAELLNEIKELRRDADEELRREPREKRSKSGGYSHEAWNVAEDVEINLELSEGYDGQEK
tara:strand:- start:1569 stop:1823 length:255 start_codon:yes stop_codon:yes gene_type:complete